MSVSVNGDERIRCIITSKLYALVREIHFLLNHLAESIKMFKLLPLLLCTFFVLDCGRQVSSSRVGHTLHHVLQRLSEETNDPSWEKAIGHHGHYHRHNDFYEYESVVDKKAPYEPQVTAVFPIGFYL